MPGFETLLLPILNRLIHRENWVLERLRPFSGSHLLLTCGSIEIRLGINEKGLFTRANVGQTINVVLALPADAPFKRLFDRNALFSSVKLSGSAELAENLAFVFRNLHWDMEGDLATVVGDISARRLSLTRKKLGHQIKDGLHRVTQNFAEYVTEDSALLAQTREIQAFASAVDHLRDDTARLEKRLKQL